MTARLFLREAGLGVDFAEHKDYEDDELEHFRELEANGAPVATPKTALQKAAAEGENLCLTGNYDAYEVWERKVAKWRVFTMKDTPA